MYSKMLIAIWNIIENSIKAIIWIAHIFIMSEIGLDK